MSHGGAWSGGCPLACYGGHMQVHNKTTLACSAQAKQQHRPARDTDAKTMQKIMSCQNHAKIMSCHAKNVQKRAILPVRI